MYQPRRVADPIETSTPAREAISKPPASGAARRAIPTFTDRVIARSGVVLAVVTVAATAGAVALGSNGGSAVALAGTTPLVSAGPGANPPATATPSPVALTLTADELAAPAAELAAPAAGAAAKTKKAAPRELVSLARLYTTGSLNVRADADSSAKLLGSISAGDRVSATGDIDGKYRKIEFDDGYGWVLEDNLSDAAPVEAAGTTMDACPRGSAIEGKLRKDTVHIYRSVCALFPAVNSFGGWRAGGMAFHKNGRAVDIMLTPHAESALGKRIAKYLISHARDFNIDHIIFEQQIWTPSTPRWRHMADRGSLNANHFNHVHVAIRA